MCDVIYLYRFLSKTGYVISLINIGSLIILFNAFLLLFLIVLESSGGKIYMRFSFLVFRQVSSLHSYFFFVNFITRVISMQNESGDRRVTRQIFENEGEVCSLCKGSLMLNPSNLSVPNIQETEQINENISEFDDTSDHIYQMPGEVGGRLTPFQNLEKFQDGLTGSRKTQRRLPVITKAQIHSIPRLPKLHTLTSEFC